jgi:hypothetical protein
VLARRQWVYQVEIANAVNADDQIVAVSWSRFRARVGSIFGRDLSKFFRRDDAAAGRLVFFLVYSGLVLFSLKIGGSARVRATQVLADWPHCGSYPVSRHCHGRPGAQCFMSLRTMAGIGAATNEQQTQQPCGLALW